MKMKKKITAVLAGCMMIGSFSTAALAAPVDVTEKPIAVQLDGQMLTLANNAQAVLNDNGRVYLPFRSLFETLGASVDYDAETGIISAARDNRTVEFLNGQPAIVIKEKGNSQIVNTGVSPYIENGQTMIPVRFAGEALGYNIGWDSTNKAVVMMDAEKLAAKYDGQFTYLEKLINFGNDYNGKNLDYTATSNIMMVDESAEQKGFIEMKLDLDGTSEAKGNTILDITMADDNKLANKRGLLANGYTQEPALAGETLEMTILCDMENLAFYVKSPLLNEQMGMNADADVYFSINLASLMTEEDIALIKNSLENGETKITDIHDYIVYFLNHADMDSVDDYESFAYLLEMLNQYFSDGAFKYDQASGRYSSQAGDISIDFKLDGRGQVSSYNAAIAQDNFSMLLRAEDDKQYVYFNMNDYGFNITMDMDMSYKVSNVKELKVNPLESNPGATIIPMM